MLRYKERKKVPELQGYIVALNREIEEHRKTCKDHLELNEFRQGHVGEISLYQDEVELIKTEAMLRAASLFLIAIPSREDEKYWSYSSNFGRNYLNSEGFERLDRATHEAKMRRFEQFQSWFTPVIAITALVVSIVGIIQK